MPDAEARKKYNREFYLRNKSYFKEYNKVYYEENKAEINEKIKEKRRNDPELRQKLYNYQKKYRDKNPDIFKFRITCECGALVLETNLLRHTSSQRHFNFLKEQEEQKCKKDDKYTLVFQ